MAFIHPVSLFVTIFFGVFVANALANTAIYHCFGLGCPGFSLPERATKSNTTCNTTTGEFYPDPEDCHSYYGCSENGTAIKLNCPEGYGYHNEWQFCVPEEIVQSCGAVYCPPYIFDGVVVDPKDCTSFYRCMYGFPRHHKCPKRSTFQPETGLCKRYQPGNEPECLKKPEEPVSTTTTTTPAPPESSTTTTLPEVTTLPTPPESTNSTDASIINS